MKNSEIYRALDDCSTELAAVQASLIASGRTSPEALYFTRYALIRACGSLEVAFKGLITDSCSRRNTKRQIRYFLDKKVRRGSRNPSFSNICSLLDDFDADWKKSFKEGITAHASASRIKAGLASLVDSRNQFAHGGSPTITMADVVTHFEFAKQAMEVLDSVVS